MGAIFGGYGRELKAKDASLRDKGQVFGTDFLPSPFVFPIQSIDMHETTQHAATHALRIENSTVAGVPSW